MNNARRRKEEEKLDEVRVECKSVDDDNILS